MLCWEREFTLPLILEPGLLRPTCCWWALRLLSPGRGLTVPWSGKAEGERRRLADAKAGDAGNGLSNNETGVVEGMEILEEGLEEKEGEEEEEVIVGFML